MPALVSEEMFALAPQTVCARSARTDLCGGCRADRHPYRDPTDFFTTFDGRGPDWGRATAYSSRRISSGFLPSMRKLAAHPATAATSAALPTAMACVASDG